MSNISMYPLAKFDDEVGKSNLLKLIDEVSLVDEVITGFAQQLLTDGEEEFVHEFHFGCNADAIELDEQEISHLDIAPPVVVSLDFVEIGQGRFDAYGLTGLHWILFNGPNRGSLCRHLRRALELERHLVARGADDDMVVALIAKHMDWVRRIISADMLAEQRQISSMQKECCSLAGSTATLAMSSYLQYLSFQLSFDFNHIGN